jgi:hypothetical protein
MKVLNLRCSHGHDFEGWFASEDDFQSQLQRHLVDCPLCGDKAVQKMPSAPRLNLGAREAKMEPEPLVDQSPTPVVSADDQGQAKMQAMQKAYLEFAREVVRSTQDVGDRFADEARRIHYGESAQRGIRGQASVQEAQALAEEGIEIAVLSLPKHLSGPLQ